MNINPFLHSSNAFIKWCSSNDQTIKPSMGKKCESVRHEEITCRYTNLLKNWKNDTIANADQFCKPNPSLKSTFIRFTIETMWFMWSV